jgi:ATP-dependent DNA helicase RecQ
VVKALTFLEEKGDLELQVAGVRQGYRVVRVPEDLAAVWHELRRRFAVRESSDIARVAAVAALVGGERCLVRRLLAYFGEEHGRDCGHCGLCAGDARAVLERATGEFTVSVDEVGALRALHPRALGGARQLARFLCGISSPALSTAKLTRHPRFGAAGEVPFAEVMAATKVALA